MHKNRILHLNIKPYNILTFPGETGANEYKLSDFGAFGALNDDGIALQTKPFECLMGYYIDAKADVW